MAVTLDGTFRIIDRASRPMRNMEKQAQATDRAVNKLGVSLDKLGSPRTIQSIERADRSMQNLSRTTDSVNQASARLNTTNQNTTRSMDANTRSTKRATGANNSLLASVSRLVLAFISLKTIMFALKLAAIVPLIGMAARAVGALGAGLVSLIPQIVELGGVAGALPATFIGMGLAMATVKLATKDLGKALGGNKEALKGLTPEARRFVDTLKSLKPLLTEARRSAQRGLFPGLERGLGAITKLAPMANRLLEMMGRRLGALASRAAGRFTTAGFMRDLFRLGQQGGRIITRMGEGLLDIADALRHVAVAAIPFTDWLTKTIGGWAEYLRRTMMVKRETGDLARFFTRVRQSLERWGHIVRDLAIGIRNIVHESRRLGRSLGDSFEEGAAKFRKWTEAFENRAKMRQFFADTKATLDALGRLAGAVLKAIGRLAGPQGGTAGFIDKLTEAVPYIERFISNLTDTLAGPLTDLFTQVGRLVENLIGRNGTGGPLVTMIRMFERMFEIVNNLVERFPALTDVIAKALSVLLVVRYLTKLKLLRLEWLRVGAAAGTAGAAQAAAAGATAGAAAIGATTFGAGGGKPADPNAPKGPGRASRFGKAAIFGLGRVAIPLMAAMGLIEAGANTQYSGSLSHRINQGVGGFLSGATGGIVPNAPVVQSPVRAPWEASSLDDFQKRMVEMYQQGIASTTAAQMASARLGTQAAGATVFSTSAQGQKSLGALGGQIAGYQSILNAENPNEPGRYTITGEERKTLKEYVDLLNTELIDRAKVVAIMKEEEGQRKLERDAMVDRNRRRRKAEARARGQKLLGEFGAGYDAILDLAGQTPNKGGSGGRLVANRQLLAQLNQALPGMTEQETMGLGPGCPRGSSRRRSRF